RNAAEDVRLANLRETDEGERSCECEASRESRELDDRLDASRLEISSCQRPFARLQDVETPVVQPRRMRHREPAKNELSRIDVEHQAAGRLLLAPSACFVRRPERRDEPDAIVDDRNAVEMTPILGRELRDEHRAPARYEAAV